MLRYSFTLNKGDINDNSIDWSERFVAQDLSYFSGVTSTSNHLEKFKQIYVDYGKVESRAPFNISATTVSRNGYIVLTNKRYDVITAKTVTYDGGYKENTFSYVDFNGMHVLVSGGSVSLKGVLCEYTVGDVRESDDIITGVIETFSYDTIVWVEHNIAVIDGNEYIVDFDAFSSDGTLGTLMDKNGNYVLGEDICACNGAKLVKFDAAKEVTKFVIEPIEFQLLDVASVNACGYENYISYDDAIYEVKKKYLSPIGGNTNWVYYCYAPMFNDGKGKVYVNVDKGNDVEATKANILSVSPYDIDDLTYFSAYVLIDGKKVMVQSMITDKQIGDTLSIRLGNHDITVSAGDKIEGTFDEGPFDLDVISYVSGNNVLDKYAIYNGIKYDVISGLIKKVKTDNNVYYNIDHITSNGIAMVEIGDELVPMKYTSGAASDSATTYGYVVVSGNTQQQTYNVEKFDGVEILGKKYEVFSNSYREYVTLDVKRKYMYEVVNVLNSSTLLCKGYLDNVSVDVDNYLMYNSNAVSHSVANQDGAEFRKVNEALYHGELTPTEVYKEWFLDGNTVYDEILENKLVIYLNNGYASLRLPMIMQGGEDPMHDDIVESEFFEAEKEKVINRIVDMEKDIYVPKTIVGTSNVFNGANETYNPIYELEFNMHFRTRDMSTWKVLEDGYDTTYGWFVTDYYPYNTKVNLDSLMETSDLYGLMGFNDVDILYQKSNLSHSFIRLSYYDSTNPQTQSLLGTSCIFIDGSAAFKKYMDNSKKVKNSYEMVGYGSNPELLMDKISASNEKVLNKGKSEYIYEDEHRMSSRLTVKNKYDSKGSSEGFYMYVFKEYTNGLHPKPIYMKAEFNHAGIGRIIPLIIPMKWKYNGNDNEYHPDTRMTLSTTQSVNELKKGYPLEAVSAQQYVPLYAVFDYKNKEYGYVFDDRYVTVEDGIAKLNLFELKIKDDSSVPSTPSTVDLTDKVYTIDANKRFKEE